MLATEDIEELQFQEVAPTITDIQKNFKNDPSRPNPTIELEGRNIQSLNSETTITEQEAVNNVAEFLDLVINESANGDNDIHQMAVAFKENLHYLGKAEFDRSVDFFADKLWDEMCAGERIVFWVPSERSELYITSSIIHRIKEKYSNGGTRNLSRVLRYTPTSKKIPDEASKVYIADDFVISGSRIREDCGKLEYFRPDLVSRLELLLLSCKDGVNPQSQDKTDIPVNSYYRVPEYSGSAVSSINNNNVSITGSHCSVDYGFEQVIGEFKDFLASKGIIYPKNLPVDIRRPYEKDSRLQYVNPDFVKLLEDIKEFELD